MCHLLTIIKTPQADNKKIARILETQITDIFSEPDGIGLMTIDNETKKVSVLRDMKDYTGIMRKAFELLPGSCFVGIHSRQATKGSKDLHNVHFFNNKNLFMAHNGTIQYSYGTTGHIGSSQPDSEFHAGQVWSAELMTWVDKKDAEEYEEASKALFKGEAEGVKPETEPKAETKEKPIPTDSDTLDFLKKLPQRLTPAILQDRVDHEFYGVGVIVDTKRHKIFHIASRNIEAITDYKTFLVSFSYTPTINQELSVFGFWVDNPNDEEIPTIDISSGVYQFNY